MIWAPLAKDLKEAGEVVGPEGDLDGVGIDDAGGVTDVRLVDDLIAARQQNPG
jgi:hypothetical protein